MTAKAINSLFDQVAAAGLVRASCPEPPEQISHSGFLVPLNSVQVTCGAVFGDPVTGPDDLVLGDTIRLAPSGVSLPVLEVEADESKAELILDQLDIGPSRLFCATIKTVTVMSEMGRQHNARVVETVGNGAFLLFDTEIALRTEYMIIDEQEQTKGSPLAHSRQTAAPIFLQPNRHRMQMLKPQATQGREP